MKEDNKRLHRCCFTGHREHKLNRSEDRIRYDLKKAIILAINGGYRTFITGMANGADIWAGEIVLELKKRLPELHLIAAVPFKGFESNWSPEWQERFHTLLSQADHVQYICPQYAQGVFQQRNEWMVNHSSRVIAVYNGKPGGTGNTIRFALQSAIPVEIIAG